MSVEELFTTRFRTFFTTALLVIGITVIVWGLSGSRPVGAADPITIDWSDISPDISPDPDFDENDDIAPADDTFFSGAANPHLDPYHGLGSSTGGLDGFTSQFFPNVGNSDVDITIYYSNNNYDGPTLEGPDLYNPEDNPNPDIRVTGDWTIRINRDNVGSRTPTTMVLSFSEPVFMDEYIVASLSTVASSHEHAIVRAFASADATGPVVKASGFINISNLENCDTLLLDQCVDDGPTHTNLLSNVTVDPDLIDAGGDGVYDNVGSAADDGLYHTFGEISQPVGYGRVKLVYGTQAIRSIAVSFFPTSNSNPDPFTDTAYTDQWISTIIAPYSFTPEGPPTAISLGQISISAENTGLVIVVLAFVMMASVSGLTFRKRRALSQKG
jgi:hypothetical protein